MVKKINKKQKCIIFIAIITILVMLVLLIGVNIITGLFVPRNNLKIGDYVEYIPDLAGAYSLPSSVSGYSVDQTIAQDINLKWQILSINGDGTEEHPYQLTKNSDIF